VSSHRIPRSRRRLRSLRLHRVWTADARGPGSRRLAGGSIEARLLFAPSIARSARGDPRWLLVAGARAGRWAVSNRRADSSALGGAARVVWISTDFRLETRFVRHRLGGRDGRATTSPGTHAASPWWSATERLPHLRSACRRLELAFAQWGRVVRITAGGAVATRLARPQADRVQARTPAIAADGAASRRRKTSACMSRRSTTRRFGGPSRDVASRAPTATAVLATRVGIDVATAPKTPRRRSSRHARRRLSSP